MTEIEALHTAARRYCINRMAELEALSDIVKKWGVQTTEMNLGPREALVEALQLAVETIVYDDMSFEECRDRIIKAALTTENDTTTCKSWRDQGIRERTQDERENLAAYIRRLDSSALLQIEPLPYRRVLTDAASADLRQRLKETWQFEDSWWIPVRPIDLKEEVLVADSDVFMEHLSDEALKQVLRDHGVRKLFRVCFYGEDPDFELELASFEIAVEWSEQVWTTEEMDWIIYIPQTGAVAVAGDWLVQEIKSLWPTWEEHPYIPPPHIPPPKSSAPLPSEAEKRDFHNSLELQVAASNGSIKKIESLMVQGVSINHQRNGGYIALPEAASRGQTEMVRFLVQHSANVNGTTFFGSTPLMLAVANGHVDVVRLLIDSGADVSLRSADVFQNGLRAGLTALEIAEQSEYLKMLEDGRRRTAILEILREKKQ